MAKLGPNEHLRFRRTKIVATVGPSSDDAATVKKLIEAGVNVFRLNMSHGDHASHQRAHQTVRRMAEELGEPVAVLVDLSGPKIRAGSFVGGSITLVDGDEVRITTRKVQGEDGLIPCQYQALAKDVKAGDRILLDDGNLELRVESSDGTEIQARVIVGGVLKDHKGMNLPGVAVSESSLTEKDREDAVFALGLGIEFLALSFVRCAEDLRPLRELAAAQDPDVDLVAKIEKPEAVENLDAILEASDAVMIARGDLGVELPPERVPLIQDRIIERARAERRAVIVATQMLESMMDRPRATRAEISDVAGAVKSGVDAIMLSGETAAGKYPVKAVTTMDQVARQTEAAMWNSDSFGSLGERVQTLETQRAESAIARATARLSRELPVVGIVVGSSKMRSTSVMSAARPGAGVFAAFTTPAETRRANLLWGVIPLTVDESDFRDRLGLARQIVRVFKLGEKGQAILLVRGFRHTDAESTPSVGVVWI